MLPTVLLAKLLRLGPLLLFNLCPFLCSGSMGKGREREERLGMFVPPFCVVSVPSWKTLLAEIQETESIGKDVLTCFS